MHLFIYAHIVYVSLFHIHTHPFNVFEMVDRVPTSIHTGWWPTILSSHSLTPYHLRLASGYTHVWADNFHSELKQNINQYTENIYNDVLNIVPVHVDVAAPPVQQHATTDIPEAVRSRLHVQTLASRYNNDTPLVRAGKYDGKTTTEVTGGDADMDREIQKRQIANEDKCTIEDAAMDLILLPIKRSEDIDHNQYIETQCTHLFVMDQKNNLQELYLTRDDIDYVQWVAKTTKSVFEVDLAKKSQCPSAWVRAHKTVHRPCKGAIVTYDTLDVYVHHSNEQYELTFDSPTTGEIMHIHPTKVSRVQVQMHMCDRYNAAVHETWIDMKLNYEKAIVGIIVEYLMYPFNSLWLQYPPDYITNVSNEAAKVLNPDPTKMWFGIRREEYLGSEYHATLTQKFIELDKFNAANNKSRIRKGKQFTAAEHQLIYKRFEQNWIYDQEWKKLQEIQNKEMRNYSITGQPITYRTGRCVSTINDQWEQPDIYGDDHPAPALPPVVAEDEFELGFDLFQNDVD